MSLPGSLFIDGTWQDARSGRLLHVLDPADGSLVVAHDAASPADVDRAVAAPETRHTGKTLRESRVDVDDVVAVLRYYPDLAVEDVTRHVPR